MSLDEPVAAVPIPTLEFTVLRCTCGEPTAHQGEVCPKAAEDGTFVIHPVPAEE